MKINKQRTSWLKLLLFIILLLFLVLSIGVNVNKETFSLAKEGKVLNISFVSDKTEWKEVNEEWGKSNHISDIISEMSLEEKIGQMVLAGISGTTLNTDTKKLINQFHVGGIIFYKNNFETPTQAVQFMNQIKAENSSNLPLFLGVDQEGGPRERPL